MPAVNYRFNRQGNVIYLTKDHTYEQGADPQECSIVQEPESVHKEEDGAYMLSMFFWLIVAAAVGFMLHDSIVWLVLAVLRGLGLL